MEAILERLKSIAADVAPWVSEWYRDGMVCCQDWAKRELAPRFGVFEVKDRSRLPAELGCLGGGGWNAAGVLDWVGFDLDVGHGNEKQKYPTTDDAIDAGRTICDLCGGAGEIRLSKSGVGVHVRVKVAAVDAGDEANARKVARNIAYWVATTCEIKCDRTVLGRQNLWYWARSTAARGFELIQGADGLWKAPAAAMREPVELRPTSRRRVLAPVAQDRRFVVERARKYMAKCAPAVSGSGGQQQTYHAAGVLAHGFALSFDEALPLYQAWNAGCVPPWDDAGLERTLHNAMARAGKGKLPLRHLLDATSLKSSVVPVGGGAVTKGYERETQFEPDEGFDPIAIEPPPSQAVVKLDADVSDDNAMGEISGEPYDRRHEEGAASPISLSGPADAGGELESDIEFDNEDSEHSTPAAAAVNSAEWFDTELKTFVGNVALAGGTKRDTVAMTLFNALASRLPGESVILKARVKKDVCEALEIGPRDFDRALVEASTRVKARTDTGWMAQANEYKKTLWAGSPRRVLRRWRERWYEWNSVDGCYLPQADEWVRAQANLWLSDQGIEISQSMTGNFMQALEAVTIIHDDVKPGCWLKDAPVDSDGAVWFSMKNGILNLCDRRKLVAHTPNYFTLNSVPFTYLAGASCPTWSDVTADWQRPVDGESAAYQILQDWMGCLFVPYNPHKKFLVCTGPGNDGKSVYSRLCRELIGERNCSAVGLESFDPAQTHGLEPMLGKMLNQIADANAVERVAEGTLKTLTGNDPYSFARKFLSSQTEVWSGKIMINANATPYWRDRSNALFNRMLPLHWNPIPDDKVNVNLVDELIAAELPGIFNWAMEGFDRVRRQPFACVGKVLQWIEDAREETQAELDFFDTVIGVDVDDGTLRKTYGHDLMTAYKAHADSMNVKAFCNDKTLGRQLREWLRRKFKTDGVPLDKQTKFFERLNGRDSTGTSGDYKRRPFYRGIFILS